MIGGGRDTAGSERQIEEGIVMTKQSTRVATAVANGTGERARLRQVLEGRRREILSEVHGRIRGVRSDAAARPHDGMDLGETLEARTQEDIELALIEMKAETVARIDAALSRIDAGTYGRCEECDDEIADARLRALPFALRCRDCEESHELDRRRAAMAGRRTGFSLFDELR